MHSSLLKCKSRERERAAEAKQTRLSRLCDSTSGAIGCLGDKRYSVPRKWTCRNQDWGSRCWAEGARNEMKMRQDNVRAKLAPSRLVDAAITDRASCEAVLGLGAVLTSLAAIRGDHGRAPNSYYHHRPLATGDSSHALLDVPCSAYTQTSLDKGAASNNRSIRGPLRHTLIAFPKRVAHTTRRSRLAVAPRPCSLA
jgi:hypothetical protein